MNRFAVRQRGDALDYAVNDGLLYVGIFDAMGHGLAAAGVAAFALRRAPPEPARPLLAAGVPHRARRVGQAGHTRHRLTRGQERWPELTSPEDLEALRASLLHLLTELRALRRHWTARRINDTNTTTPATTQPPTTTSRPGPGERCCSVPLLR
jgi:hypothetical protein